MRQSIVRMLDRITELYSFRELMINLTIKELKVRYKNSVLGFFWSLINPLLQMIVFTFIFSFVFKAGIENFPIFFLVGFLPWNFFSVSLLAGTGSIVNNANLIKKVYFPRELIPASIVIANLVNFLLGLLVLFIFLIFFGYKFYLLLPILLLVIILETLMTAGFALIFASLNVFLRDIEQLMNILLMVWFYATPIVYDMSMIPSKAQPFLKILNPMTSIIFLYRETLYHYRLPSAQLLIYAIFSSVGIALIGYLIFNHYSPSFPKEV